MNRQHRPKSVRLLVFILVSALFTFFAAILFTIFHTTMPKMLLESENRYQLQQLKVMDGLFAAALRNTYLFADDIAVWEETVAFVEGRNPNYIADNWPDASIVNSLRLNFVILKNTDLHDVFLDFHDYLENKPLPVPAGFGQRLDRISAEVLGGYRPLAAGGEPPAMSTTQGNGGKLGIIIHNGIPYSVAVAPVVGSKEAAQPSGVLIIGNILSSAYFQDLTQYSSRFEILGSADSQNLNKADIQLLGNDIVSTYLPMIDLDGTPMTLRMSDSRDIYTEGKSLLDMASVLLLAAMVLFATTLYLVITRFLFKPLEQFGSDLANVDASRWLDTGKYSKSREFVDLCASVNGMLRRLNQSQVSLDVLEKILHNMDSFIYVTDPETDEILFVNRNLGKHFGIGRDVIGHKCWQEMQANLTERCAFCPKPKLVSGQDSVVTWEERNTRNGRCYRNTDTLIDWPGRGRMHLQHSVDITSIREAEAALAKRLQQQELMSAMSQILISTESTDKLIGNVLKMAGEFLNVSKIIMALVNEKTGTLDEEYSWYNPERQVIRSEAINIPFHAGIPEYDCFMDAGLSYMICEDLSKAPGHEYAIEHGIKAYAAAALYTDGKFRGLLSFNEVAATRAWSDSDIQLVRLIGSLISTALSRVAMEKSLLRMSSIADGSPQYITHITKDGLFEYINGGALKVLGYSSEELKENGLPLIFDPETYRKIREELIPRTMHTGAETFELTVITKSGEKRIMAFSAFTTGADSGIGAIATDMTEQRKLEKELIEARDQAEQSSRAKSEFLSRMSHEMRTPMNAIIGMTGIAKNSPDFEKNKYCLEKIDDASKHLLGVINDILDMSKIEANKLELSFSEFNFERMLMRVVNVVNFRVEEKRQKFMTQLDGKIPRFVVSDEQRLAQVITNLLSNAVKFTPENGSITMKTTLVSEENGNCLLQISVTDSGIGISREQQSKLFSSFEQADGGIARKFGGTGLGLVISKNIVQLMGGEIWINSALGHGATFAFRVPVRRGSGVKPDLPAPRQESETQASCFRGCRILLAEDIPINSEIALTLLEDTEAVIDCAQNGLEAFQRFRDNPGLYDLILMDIHMPEVDGYEATRRIRSLSTPEAGRIPIVAMTANVFREDIEKCLAAGMNDHIGKPLDLEEILAKLKKHLSPKG